MTSALVSDDITLAADTSNLAPVLLKLRNNYPGHYEAIRWSIKTVAPFFDDFVLEPSGETIQLRWRQKGLRSVLPASRLSSGTLRFICLTVLLHQPELPRTIVLDEPELGLHPLAIVQFVEVLRKAAVGRRIILATQSVTLINQFSVDEIVLANRSQGETKLTRPEADQLTAWLDDYSLGELWEHNILRGGYPSEEGGAAG